jgi:hypothetical protein
MKIIKNTISICVSVIQILLRRMDRLDWFQAGPNLCLLHIFQTASEDQPASYPMATAISLPWGNALIMWRWLLTWI